MLLVTPALPYAQVVPKTLQDQVYPLVQGVQMGLPVRLHPVRRHLQAFRVFLKTRVGPADPVHLVALEVQLALTVLSYRMILVHPV